MASKTSKTSKTYTAQEMRYAADVREAWGDKDEVNNMLRQAADMIESEAAKDEEIAELRGALKKAYATLYSISCARYGKGLTCTDSIHELVTMAREVCK